MQTHFKQKATEFKPDNNMTWKKAATIIPISKKLPCYENGTNYLRIFRVTLTTRENSLCYTDVHLAPLAIYPYTLDLKTIGERALLNRCLVIGN